jgi:hypothetical protein
MDVNGQNCSRLPWNYFHFRLMWEKLLQPIFCSFETTYSTGQFMYIGSNYPQVANFPTEIVSTAQRTNPNQSILKTFRN